MIDLVVGDLGKNPSEPGLGIKAIELGSFDQNIIDGSSFTSAFRPHEQIIFPTQGHTADRSFRRIFVQFETAAFPGSRACSSCGQGHIGSA